MAKMFGTTIGLPKHTHTVTLSHPFLAIPPISQLRHQRPIPNPQVLRIIIIRIDDEEVRSRTIPPLHPQVEIDVFVLVVELDEVGKEQLIGQCKVDPGAD